MNDYIIFLTVSILLTLVIYFYKRFPNYPTLKYPQLMKTASFDTLKKVALDKVKYIECNSGLLRPYNKRKMEECKKAITNADDYKELCAACLTGIMPNNDLGTYPISKLDSIEDSMLFRFEQGIIGWYWGYATYDDANVMYYIMRLDLGIKQIRDKYCLPLGATTVYFISMGVGNGKNTWRYSPYIICPGTYTVTDPNNFKFTAEWSTYDGGSIEFVSTDKKFTLNFICKQIGNDFSAYTEFEKVQPANFNNGEGGCAPCRSGTGTLYVSYPQLSCKSQITIGSGTTTSHSNGDGWFDHQWMRSNTPRQLLLDASLTIMQTRILLGGLGRYMWINFHIDGGVQYMVTCFPGQESIIKVGDEYPTRYNTYSKNLQTPIIHKIGKLKILETVSVSNIVFPSILSVELEDINGDKQVYTADSTPYGNCVTLDISGNLHWSGSAKLSGGQGSAFLEFNQFQDLKMYLSNTLDLAKIPVSNIDLYIKPNISFIQAIPSILFLLLLPTLVIILIILVVKR